MDRLVNTAAFGLTVLVLPTVVESQATSTPLPTYNPEQDERLRIALLVVGCIIAGVLVFLLAAWAFVYCCCKEALGVFKKKKTDPHLKGKRDRKAIIRTAQDKSATYREGHQGVALPHNHLNYSMHKKRAHRPPPPPQPSTKNKTVIYAVSDDTPTPPPPPSNNNPQTHYNMHFN